MNATGTEENSAAGDPASEHVTAVSRPARSATEEVVDFVRTATPRAVAREHAADALARFRSAERAGAAGDVVRALSQALGLAGYSPDEPPADPARHAWLSGTAAASAPGTGHAAGPDDWTAVCAAAIALERDPGRLVEAVAIGREVASATADTLGATHRDAGWDVGATVGTIGAGAAAGRLLGLDADGLRHLLGLCATQAAGLDSARGTAAGALQTGKAAGNAVEAAQLARNGFTSSAHPLEGRRGMFALMSRVPAGGPAAVRLDPGR